MLAQIKSIYMILLVGKQLHKSSSVMVYMRFLAVGYNVNIIMSRPSWTDTGMIQVS